tara:strand:+ start:1067 stop:1495 length:429 start_codon:yes stop_codon:yes gene_type:complete
MDYDNTNSGIGFQPFSDQKLILQGKLDVNSTEHKFAYVSCENKDGSKRVDVYRKLGAIFPNKKEGNENKPDYTGKIENTALDTTSVKEYRLAGWRKTNDEGKSFMTFAVSETLTDNATPALESERDVLAEETVALTEDEVPF